MTQKNKKKPSKLLICCDITASSYIWGFNYQYHHCQALLKDIFYCLERGEERGKSKITEM